MNLGFCAQSGGLQNSVPRQDMLDSQCVHVSLCWYQWSNHKTAYKTLIFWVKWRIKGRIKNSTLGQGIFSPDDHHTLQNAHWPSALGKKPPPPAQPSPAMCEQVAQAWHSSLSVCARAPGCQYQVIKWTRLKYFCHNYGDTVVHSERMPWGPLTDGQGALQMTRQNKKVYGLLSNGISGSEILVSLKTVWFPVTLHKIPYFR